MAVPKATTLVSAPWVTKFLTALECILPLIFPFHVIPIGAAIVPTMYRMNDLLKGIPFVRNCARVSLPWIPSYLSTNSEPHRKCGSSGPFWINGQPSMGVCHTIPKRRLKKVAGLYGYHNRGHLRRGLKSPLLNLEPCVRLSWELLTLFESGLAQKTIWKEPFRNGNPIWIQPFCKGNHILLVGLLNLTINQDQLT